MGTYNPNWVEAYFDDFGEKEWNRLVEAPVDEVKLYVHTHYLREHVCAGDKVLEIGAGAGRFTQILIELGAKVTVADISNVQLQLNRQHAAELGFAHGIEDWIRCDICDLSMFASGCFDCVICYGGPLSYVFDQRDRALLEIMRVLNSGGNALISVMSLWGTIQEFLNGVLAVPGEINAEIISTGDLCPATLPTSKHHCHMFRSDEFRSFLEDNGGYIISMSASNSLSAAWKDRLIEIRKIPEQWEQLLRLEIEACGAPGSLDTGTHMIAVVGKP